MSIEKTADVDEQGFTRDPKKPSHKGDAEPQGSETVDWQGLTPASDAKSGEPPNQVPDEMGDKPERGVEIDRSPKPDARDDAKVERLAAPDWRSDQSLPSAKNAVDPRGENTPEELFEEPEESEHK